MEATFFSKPADLRKWFRRNHTCAKELWVGFHRKRTGRPSLTWPESVDEALCVGWIDGIRKSIDQESYMIRFTPRRRRSTWSTVNIRRAEVLTNEKRMKAAGLAVFAVRIESRSGIYSYEQRSEQLPEPYASELRMNRTAWKFFRAQPPSYRKAIGWWVVSAKQEDTRRKRLAKLIAESAHGHRLR
ncbi:MAG: YdeI/OmpD-associated family protein [Chthoniobacterales bacterium]